MKVIVTGSLGHVGKPLTIGLIKKGHSVVVVSSKEDRKKEIESLGAVAAIGSLEDVDFLTKTCTGADILFALIPPNFGEPDVRVYYKRITNNYIKAIQQAGVKRVIHLSSYGADIKDATGFIKGSYDSEVLFNQLDQVSVVHLRPGFFYTNLYNFIGMIHGLGFIAANYGGDDLMVVADPRDIADVAIEELETKGANHKVRYIASDERTANEIAHALGLVIGKPDMKWMIISDEQMQKGMEQNGIPATAAANFVEMGAATHSGILRGGYDANKPKFGKIKLEDFAREFALAY